MLNSNHFSKFHHQSIASSLITPLTIPTIPVKYDAKSSNEKCDRKSNDSNRSSNIYSSQTKQLKHKKPDSPVPVYSSNGVSCRLKNSIMNQPELKCLICNKQFDHSSTQQNDHQHSQLGVKLADAKNQQLPPLVKLIQHLQNAHKITNVCTNCGAFFKNTEELQKHLVEESYHHHSYTNQYQNYNPTIRHKPLKRTSSNSNLNVKKFKPTETDQMKSNRIEVDTSNNRNKEMESNRLLTNFSDNLKLNLLLNNKQRNESNFNSKLNTNSISPSSTSSYSYSSSNSSPPSFLFEQSNVLPQQKEKFDSHPLLALQMFVNGSNTLAEAKVSHPPPPPPLLPLNTTIELNKTDSNYVSSSKLPAKKRPYIEDNSNMNEIENSRSSFKQLVTNEKQMDDMSGSFLISKLSCKNEENCLKRSKPNSDDLDSSLTKENKKCHSPLNLLQKMQIGLDDYLMR